MMVPYFWSIAKRNSLYSERILLKDGSLYYPQELYSYSFTALKVAEERLSYILSSQT